jgi:L-2,4-diaminobutyrate transaminase
MHAHELRASDCRAVALKNIEIMERERLWETPRRWARACRRVPHSVRGSTNTGDIRSGKGLLAAVEFVEDRATRKNFATGLKFAARLKNEMMKRGVITRTRPAVGAHPAPGDVLFFAPPLVATEADIDRLVNVTRDAVTAVLSSQP